VKLERTQVAGILLLALLAMMYIVARYWRYL